MYISDFDLLMNASLEDMFVVMCLYSFVVGVEAIRTYDYMEYSKNIKFINKELFCRDRYILSTISHSFPFPLKLQ